ncbi:hypothetical protein ACW7GZ_14780 [Luteimonas sp. A537]
MNDNRNHLRVIRFFTVSALLLAAAWAAYRIYQDDATPPPFVYLIPDDYFGPIVTFFGQPGGIEMKPDPLGRAVDVPDSGLIRIRAERQDVMGISGKDYRATYFVSIAPDGSRKIMKVLTDVYREKGVWWQGVIDEGANMTRYDIGEATKGNFEHLPEYLRDEHMVAARQGCRFRFVNADEESQKAGCDEFVVISPDKDMEIGNWLWGDFGSYFESLDAFTEHVRNIQHKKQTYIEASPE